jgi:hypothetical protein
MMWRAVINTPRKVRVFAPGSGDTAVIDKQIMIELHN